MIRVPDRDRVLADLQAAGIGAAIHYPTPIHRTRAFASLGSHSRGGGCFQVAERTAPQLLSLPLYAEITAAQQERVVEGPRRVSGLTATERPRHPLALHRAGLHPAAEHRGRRIESGQVSAVGAIARNPKFDQDERLVVLDRCFGGSVLAGR